MKIELNEMPCFGVAGNFTGHLEQAGEAVDFANVVTKEANAPKAMFPTYIPGNSAEVPEFLHTFPFECGKIIFPANEQKLQIEPECAIICCLEWNGENVVSVKPVAFGASNDCSIRKEGAKKISQKKNWGPASKGLSENQIELTGAVPQDPCEACTPQGDKDAAKSNGSAFSKGGLLDNYRIASFLVRDGKVFDYGEDSAVRDYSYIYEKLLSWICDKLNNQGDEGPAENIHAYLLESGKPSQVMISIGATRYTDFGEHNFLSKGDRAVVVVYSENKYDHAAISKMVKNQKYDDPMVSVLDQVIEV